MTESGDCGPNAGTARGYDALAERADEDALDRAESPWGDSHFQRYYAWPATRELVPPVDGDAVLVAGCGRGDHVGWFLDRGATVVGVDASERALGAARERFGDRATFRRADLTDPLDFDDGAFDLVVSHLVLSHVERWRPVFEEFRRVLSANGAGVFGVVHPQYFRAEHGVTDELAVERLDVSWPGAEIPTYYRPTNAALAAVVAAGFELDAVEEPTPRAAYAAHAPERYEKAMESPQVLCVRARA